MSRKNLLLEGLQYAFPLIETENFRLSLKIDDSLFKDEGKIKVMIGG